MTCFMSPFISPPRPLLLHRLKHAEDVALGIFAIGERADAGDFHFVRGHGSAGIFDFGEGGVDVFDAHGADERIDRCTVRRAVATPWSEAAVDARHTRAGPDYSIVSKLR